MIAATIERLLERATVLSSVSPAEELEALTKGVAPKNGATFVLPFEERPDPNPFTSGGFRQRVEVLILVAFILRHANDVQGAKRAGSFDTFRQAIEAALAGWAPVTNGDPFELAAARSASLGNGATVYVQTWRTYRYLEIEE